MSDLGRRTLLLVEDNPDDEELIRWVLRKTQVSADVVVARDGKEAIEYLCRGELPDVVLLDLELPRMGGHEVLRRIRAEARTRLLPVIILTGSKEQRDVKRSYELGANSYVLKSVDGQLFKHTVEQVGLYWLFVNVPVER